MSYIQNGSAGGGGTGTVTHTAGALTANQVVIGNGTDDLKVLGSLGTTTTVLHGNAAGAPTYGAVVLTTDVSGVLPVANGGGPTVLIKGSDQTGIGETYTDVTGLTISVSNGQTLRFHAYLRATTDATTTGLLMAVNGPSSSVLTVSTQMFTGGSTFASGSATTYNSNAPANTGSVTDGMAFLHGIVTFTANGTFALRARAETGSGGTVGIMANSWVEYYLV